MIRKLLTLFLIADFLFARCSDSENIASSSITVSQLSNDISLTEYIQETTSFADFTVKEGIDEDKLIEDLSNISSTEDFNSKIKAYFQEPEAIIEKFKDLQRKSSKFWESNKSLKQQIDRDQVLQRSIDAILSKSKKTQSTIARKDPCQQQYDSDIQTCQEGSYAAAAFCGLLSPTLLGALGCGAGVLVGDVVCHRAAERDRKICLNPA
ncbi:MAG TPA: hypothetical protein VIN08_12230 [Ohtaekwangia sp.]|uniref:hypothetical protein n=1 Tax=Ohtaekwangia sp. TaxID=2066019 RepID=UPI002F95FAC2